MTIEPQGQLHVLNRTSSRARLRFLCHGLQLWDTWLVAGSSLAAPDPRDVEIIAEAIFVDPRTHVTYTAISRVTRTPARIVAKQTFVDGAGCFDIDHEVAGQAGEIRLLNLTSATTRFSLCFVNSPFRLSAAIAPQAEHVQNASIEVVATIDGITAVSGIIGSWAVDVVIDSDDMDGQISPRIKVTPRGSLHRDHIDGSYRL